MEDFRAVTADRKAYLPLLLEADPDTEMIGWYLERGRMYVLEDGGKAWLSRWIWRTETAN